MIITNLAQAKKDKERVNVFVDGEFYLGLDKNTIVKAGLFKGKEITEEQLQQLASRDAVEYLSRRLIAWCFKKPRSEKELADKVAEMLAKRADEKIDADKVQITEEVVERLKSKGNTDEHFAEWFAGERARQRKYGRNKVVADLLAKGVKVKVAKVAAYKAIPEEEEMASEVLQKKYGLSTVKEIADYSEKSKAINFLRSRGFSDFR